MEHEIYVSREVKNLGHNNSAALIKKAVNMALDAEGVDVPCIVSVMLTDDGESFGGSAKAERQPGF